MKAFKFVLLSLLLYAVSVQTAYAWQTLQLTRRTTPQGIYEQLGSHGESHSDEGGAFIVYSGPMTVVFESGDSVTVCKAGCDYKAMFVNIAADKERSGTLANLFPGLFRQEVMITDIWFD